MYPESIKQARVVRVSKQMYLSILAAKAHAKALSSGDPFGTMELLDKFDEEVLSVLFKKHEQKGG